MRTSAPSPLPPTQAVPPDASFLTIPRPREVGQSHVTALLPTAAAFLASLRHVAALRPDVLLVNGPGTCLPVAAAARVASLLTGVPTVIVFVESVCRVTDLSATGRILYATRLADAVLVQWPALVAAYPRAAYIGLQL